MKLEGFKRFPNESSNDMPKRFVIYHINEHHVENSTWYLRCCRYMQDGGSSPGCVRCCALGRVDKEVIRIELLAASSAFRCVDLTQGPEAIWKSPSVRGSRGRIVHQQAARRGFVFTGLLAKDAYCYRTVT